VSCAGRVSFLVAVAFVSILLVAWGQEADFVRGDVNVDGKLNVADAVANARYVLGGGFPLGCQDAADANDDGRLDLSDAFYILQFLFAEGPAIPAPAGSCGPDPTLDALSCEKYTCRIKILLPGGVPLEMKWCPAGMFLMGRYNGEKESRSEEDPQHSVTLTRGFWLGKYEVTKRQWEAVMETTPWVGREYVLDHPDSPAVYVSWNDAQEFVARMNSLGRGLFRLPTEAEWEYACRAGTTTRFYWGDDLAYTSFKEYAWFDGNARNIGERYAHVVGLKRPNAWGLYDMSGNVWEWCQDWYAEGYPDGPVTDPTGPGSGSTRARRGGAWNSDEYYCRSASRAGGSLEDGFYYLGLRLARE